ncbi:MAG: hypothetical protein Q9227_005734 [Pyrenula ochraceoflavens]
MASAMFLASILFHLVVNFIYPVAPSVLRNSAVVNETTNATAAGNFLLGVGKADITGYDNTPKAVVEINFAGYADTSQIGTGLRQRIYTRAFIVANPDTPSDRFVYLVLDAQSGDTAVRNGIIEGLAALGGDYAVYNKDNVAVTGTHAHSSTGGWFNYLLPQITSLGFDHETYDALVQGSITAIQRAHTSLRPGRLSVGTGQVSDGNANRSPYAYLANPASERAQYTANTDTTMTLLKFEDTNGTALGLLNWFPVHGTSLYENNTLVTGDNKGVAATMYEDSIGIDSFVAGFSQANVGDTTPNVLGAFCEDGTACRFNDSTCNGKTQGCQGRGPFFQNMDQGAASCYEIGTRQFTAAQNIFNSDLAYLDSSTVSSFHTFVDMENYTFVSPLTNATVRTCSAALGYSFAGGTSDGAGQFDFTQGINTNDTSSPALQNPLWKIARDALHDPSPDQRACQNPKPILLDIGATTFPYQWGPNIVDIQMLRAGPLLIIVSPGEATTMTGRRWRNAVAQAAPSILGINTPTVVLGGPSNSYTHYIATEEEYSVQRYEGASTLYGPHTLEAYINLTLSYMPYLSDTADRSTIPAGPNPPINTNNSLSFITPVIVDNPAILHKFGDALKSPSTSTTYSPGSNISATFVGANPRNNLRLGGTFAAVDKQDPNTKAWSQVLDDSAWNLVYRWTRTSTILGTSEVTIYWIVGSDVESGTYRIHYYGDAKAITGQVGSFEGFTNGFAVNSG